MSRQNRVISNELRHAAKTGFVRTATQSLASIIPTGAIAIGVTSDFWVGAGLGAAGAVATAVLAGTASALSIVSRGLPEAYVDAAGPGTHLRED